MRFTMKKKLIALLAVCLMLFALVGCGRSYQDATTTNVGCSVAKAKGYFTIVEYWGGGAGSSYYIVYANDTKVMYFLMCDADRFGITPLYNADGTLQIYGKY